MTRNGLLAGAICLAITAAAGAREAKLLRSPHYHDGKVAFSYLGDIWTAREDGKEVVRLTVNKASDVTPRFSPDGRWIAFSSDRDGGLDVYRMPAAGGEVKRLTVHSADDRSWAGPATASRSSLPASAARVHDQALHRLRSTGAWPRSRAPTWASPAATRPTAPAWPSTARRRPTGEVLPRRLPERRHRHGPGDQDLQGPHRVPRHGLLADVEPGRLHLLRLRARRQLPGQHLAHSRERRQCRARDRLHVRRRPIPGDLEATARRSSSNAISASPSSTSPPRRSSR